MNPTNKGPQFGDQFEEDLRTMWPNHSANEISAAKGYKVSLIYKWVKIWGLQHTPDTKKRLFDRRQHNLLLSHTPEVTEKIRKARLHNDRMERFRVMSGMPKKTKYHIAVVPSKTRCAMYNLCRSRNYYRTDDKSSYVLFYDSHTKRAGYHGYDEAYFSKRYGIEFVESEEVE